MAARLERKGPRILEGAPIRAEMRAFLTEEVAKLPYKPKLVILQVGNRPDSTQYVKQKRIVGKSVGMDVSVETLEEGATLDSLVSLVKDVQSDKSVDGVMIQSPVPGLSKKEQDKLKDTIDPRRDPDGLTATNLGLLAQRRDEGFNPATAEAVGIFLDYHKIPVKKKRVTDHGRGPITGEPIRLILQDKGATVTTTHTDTPKDESRKDSRRADIVVVAIGKPQEIDHTFFKRGQTVIDVGTHKVGEKYCGDVKFDRDDPDDLVAQALGKKGAIAPSPGGVGQVTVPALLLNTLNAARMRRGQERVIFKMKRE